jgi:N-acetyltransferase
MPDQPSLSGHGIRLIPLAMDHIPALWKIGQSPSIWTYMPDRMASESDMEAYVSHALQARDAGVEIPFATVLAQTGEIIGSTRFYEVSAAHLRAEIGYTWVHPNWQRTFVNTAAKYLMLAYGFDTRKWHRIALRTDNRNLVSQAAIERLGAKREGILRRHMVMPDGYHRDTVYYSILDTEWETVRDRLFSKMRPE